MKTPYYTVDEFLDTLAGSLAFFFLLTFFTPMYRLISFVVDEKSSWAWEGMKIMGLTDTPYWLSWFIYYFLVSTAISIFGAGILKINIFIYTPYWMLFLFLWLYGLALFSLALLITCFIERPRTAGIIATLAHFLTYFFGAPITQPAVSAGYKLWFSFFPNISMNLLTNTIVTLENRSVGATWSTFSDDVDYYTVWIGFWALLIDFLVLLILALYLDNVLPKQFGVK